MTTTWETDPTAPSTPVGAPRAIVESKMFPGLAGRNAEKLGQAEQLVAGAIATCAGNAVRCPELVLRELELVGLPLNMSGLSALVKLDCCNNDLTELSPGIDACANLEILECHHNPRLKRFPKSLADCENLRFITCFACDFEERPDHPGVKDPIWTANRDD